MNHLRSVYGPILELQNLEETFLERATAEYEARVKFEKSIENTQLSQTNVENEERVDNKSNFLKYLNMLSMKLKLLSGTYQVRIF